MALDGIGSSLIAAAGGGTGAFNVESISKGLSDADTMADRTRLTNNQESSSAKLSALSQMKSSLDVFKTNISALTTVSSLQNRQVISSDVLVMSATADSSAKEGNYSIQVNKLAKSHSIHSSRFSNLTDTVGSGTLTFQFGTSTKAVSSGDTITAAGKIDSDGIVVTVAGIALTIPDNQNLSTEAGVDAFIGAVKTAINSNTTLAGQGVTATIADSATAGADTLAITDAQGDALTIAVAAPTGGTNPATATEVASALGAVDTFLLNTKKSGGLVTIGSTNNTLEGMRDAINSAKLGVQAAVINDGSGYRLSYTSTDTGANNAMQVVVNDTGDSNSTDSSGLSQFRFDQSYKHLTESTPGQDASLTINGLTISSENNTVTKAITGVTLNLNSTNISAKTLTIANDRAATKEKIKWFVEDLNALKGELGALNAVDIETGEKGAIQGDSMLRGLIRQVRSITGNIVPNVGSVYNTLSTIGITLSGNINGTYKIDDAKLDKALKSNFDDVVKVFAATATPTDSLVKLDSFKDKTKSGSYALTVNTIATKGSLVPSDTITSSSAPVVNANNDTFLIRVDGTLSTTVTLSQKTYSSSYDLAAEMQSKINGDKYLKAAGKSVSVAYDSVNNKFSFTSNRYGSSSTVAITTVDVAAESAKIGLSTTGTATTGVNVAGTINGIAATGNGQYLTAESGDPKDLKLLITGGVTGSRGSVSVGRGYADQLTVSLNNYIASNGLITGREKTLNDRINGYGDQEIKLDEKYDSLIVKYRKQFSMLNALLGEMETQRESMKATFEGMFGNN